ncbi:MerR family transcriptional regulator [Bacillus sp. 31A1R]|uniref:MerR family transcriptional regulator n=1 Tax=Robertmurraya mangrovi TaxID=3098077 RepID=A0ABU5J3F2_9BACI|nr:MerR family transcriptional regulator [Bacillus sp. 31A1R]MDZ5473872.1 MerR family transcriptional regulator [Bacillus sp. 31A1R]
MNTNVVAKILGVSTSTVKRWVKQLGLQLEKNEFGHFMYTKNDIKVLKGFKEKVQAGSVLQDVSDEPRKGVINASTSSNYLLEKLMLKVELLETSLRGKADDVVTYQLLQQRREIEELESQIKLLTEKLKKLEAKQATQAVSEEKLVVNIPKQKNTKKKNIISMFF